MQTTERQPTPQEIENEANERGLGNLNDQISEVKGDYPDYDKIDRDFIQPEEEELLKWKGEDYAPFRGTDPREKYIQEQNEGEGQTEPATGYDERQLDQRVIRTESRARERHDGSDNLPPYSEIVDTLVCDLIRQKPEIFEALCLMDDPAESAFQLGLMIKYPNAADLLEAGGQIDDDDLVDRLNVISEMAGKYTQFLKDFHGAAKRAASRRSGELKPAQRRPAGRWDMPVRDFERELDRFLREGD
jgi:hypothetical protein